VQHVAEIINFFFAGRTDQIDPKGLVGDRLTVIVGPEL